MKIKLFFVSLFLLLFAGSISAQNIKVSGVVTDAATGEPIPYAYVKVVGTNNGTSTNDVGEYSITVPGTAVFEVTFVGYTTIKVPVNGRSKINITLSSDAVNLDDVLVVAYGTTTKKAFTGSAATVKQDKLENLKVANVSKALEGTVAGVQVTGGSGQPGSKSSIRIRGIGSVNASSTPLYVVDGAPYDGDLNSIPSEDIENISVLKDATASALYGAR